MNINSSQLISGVPILQIRTFLRKNSTAAWTLGILREENKLNSQQAHELLAALIQDGFVEVAEEGRGLSRHCSQWEDHNKVTFYAETTKGAALSNASAAKSIHRKTASL